MRFAIMNGYSIIKLVDTEEEFVDHIREMIPGSTFVEFLTDQDLKERSEHPAGKYLLKTGNVIQLIEKRETKDTGYLFSSTHTDVEKVNEWSMFNYDVEDTVSPEDNNLGVQRLNIGIVPPINFNMDRGMADIPIILHIGKRGCKLAEQSIKIVKHLVNKGELKESNVHVFAYSDCDKWKRALPGTKRYNIGDLSHSQTDVQTLMQSIIDAQELSGDEELKFIVTDLYVTLNGNKQSEVLETLMFESKKRNIGTIFHTQYSMGLGTRFRNQLDHIFMHDEDYHSNKRRLYEHYAGMFPSYTQFDNHFKTYTNNFSSMVITNRPGKDVVNKIHAFSA